MSQDFRDFEDFEDMDDFEDDLDFGSDQDTESSDNTEDIDDTDYVDENDYVDDTDSDLSFEEYDTEYDEAEYEDTGDVTFEEDNTTFEDETDQYADDGSYDYENDQSEYSDAYESLDEDDEENIGYADGYVDSSDYDNGYDTSDEGIDEEIDESVPKRDMILYVITDRPFNGLINYMRESGLNVSQVFGNIADARNELLLQTEPYRLVIIDTGLGRFTTTNQRKELIDMLAMCNDEDNRASVFYTDSVLKIDSTREIGKTKSITWDKYKNTAFTTFRLLKIHENFVFSDEVDKDVPITMEDVKDYIGLTSREQLAKVMQVSITPELVLQNIVMGTEDVLEEYTPNI